MNRVPKGRHIQGFDLNGYFACVSRSQVPTVTRYIANQREHHHNIDSAAEFELLLKRHGFELRD